MIPRDLLVGVNGCRIFDTEDEIQHLRLPFSARCVRETIRILQYIHEHKLSRIHIPDYITPRKNNMGVWMYRCDIDRAVGGWLSTLIKKNKTLVEELVRMQHFLDCPRLGEVTSIAFVYHQLKGEEHYVVS